MFFWFIRLFVRRTKTIHANRWMERNKTPGKGSLQAPGKCGEGGCSVRSAPQPGQVVFEVLDKFREFPHLLIDRLDIEGRNGLLKLGAPMG